MGILFGTKQFCEKVTNVLETNQGVGSMEKKKKKRKGAGERERER